MSVNELPVTLPGAPDHKYPIVIGPGLIETLATRLQAQGARKRLAVVTDTNVARYHLMPLRDGLEAAGYTVHTHIVAAGEASKNFETLEAVVTGLIEAGIERNDQVLALGGGVVGDLTGFACSMVRRGCRFIQVPTTLLAQVDSAVGGKTAINVAAGKNLVGAFYQPDAVFSDTDSLSTLARREWRAGYAEIVKYGLLGDADFFAWLEANGPSLLGGENAALVHAIRTSCTMKAAIVAEDEREKGRRALLNLGHTFGHALEAETGFGSTLLHGEAVSIGMVLAFDFAVTTGLCAPADAKRVRDHLAACGCPVSPAEIDAPSPFSAEALMARMAQDKKVEDGRITLILPHRIGEARIHRNVDAATIKTFLETTLNHDQKSPTQP